MIHIDREILFFIIIQKVICDKMKNKNPCLDYRIHFLQLVINESIIWLYAKTLAIQENIHTYIYKYKLYS